MSNKAELSEISIYKKNVTELSVCWLP